MANYSIGTATQYDELPLLPSLKNAITTTFLGDSSVTTELNGGASTILSDNSANVWVYSPSINRLQVRYRQGGVDKFMPIITIEGGQKYKPVSLSRSDGAYTVGCDGQTITTPVADDWQTSIMSGIRGGGYSVNIGLRHNLTVSGNVWLNQISDYKSTKSGFTIVGTPNWYKLASDGNEINNYLTPALFLSAVTTPTEPVVVYILDKSTDISSIPSTINGQPITLDYSFSGDKNKSFDFGFSFNF
jgi:hypothetical protein